MDTLTHIAVGACIGEIFAGKALGKRAIFLGAALQSLPDIDFIATSWLDPVSDLLAHRGITHSILFVVCITPLLSWLALKIHPKHDVSFPAWNLFFGTELFVHLFLDAFNSYGTGWFEPFSHARITFNSIFVADPLFSIVPLIVFMALLWTHRHHRRRNTWSVGALVYCAIYLGISLFNKMIVVNAVKKSAAGDQLTYKRYFTTPTPLNTLLWYVVLENDSGYNIGYRSVFDTAKKIDFLFFPKNEQLLGDYKEFESVKKLKTFSQQYYTIEKWSDTLVFNDLRFGQMIGWEDLSSRFVFHYYLNFPKENLLVVQRGRFAGWDKKAVLNMISRIRGR